jgi:hypothetical protein
MTEDIRYKQRFTNYLKALQTVIDAAFSQRTLMINSVRKYGLAGLVYAVRSENRLGEVNSNGYDNHDSPSQVT